MKKLLTVLAGSALFAVAGCSGGGGSTATGASSTTAAPKPGDVVQASSFTPRLQSAMKGAKTMHLKMTLKSPAIYLKSAALPVGGKWVVAKEGGTDMLSKQLAPLFEQIKQMQPEQQVSNYAVADQKVVGQETVDGVATTHYTSSPTAAQIKKALAPALAAQLSDADLKDLKVDMWVDAQNRPHKVVSTMTAKGQKVSTTVLLSRFGEPVTITAPPAAQTTTAP